METLIVAEVTIIPLPDQTSLKSIRLDFSCATQSAPIQLELPASLAKGVAEAILEVLGTHNDPSPPIPSPSGAHGKPKLWIVK